MKSDTPLKSFERKALKQKVQEIKLSSFNKEAKAYLKKKAKERYK